MSTENGIPSTEVILNDQKQVEETTSSVFQSSQSQPHLIGEELVEEFIGEKEDQGVISHQSMLSMIAQQSVFNTPTTTPTPSVTPMLTPVSSKTGIFIHRFIPDLKDYSLLDYASIYYHREKARFFRQVSVEDMITYSPAIPLRPLHKISGDRVMEILNMERLLLPIVSGCPHAKPQDNSIVAGHLTGDDKSALEMVLYTLSMLHSEVDEVYAYILKMLTENPSPANELKGFEVLYVLTRCIPPSNHFFNYCLQFCYDHVFSHNEGVS